MGKKAPTLAKHLSSALRSVDVTSLKGKDDASALEMLGAARPLEQAGAAMLLLECVPRELSARITAVVAIPVIGIGAAPECDGQVLVMHDMLGISPGKPARFVKDFMAETGDIRAAFKAYDQAVKDGSFPADEHCF